MATISIELFTSKKLKKENDRHPIYITVRKGDTVSRKKVGAATVDEWDPQNKRIKPKGRKTHVADTIFIEDEFEKYNAKFKYLERSGKHWIAEDVFKEEVEAAEKQETFYTVGEAYLESIRHKNSYYNAKSRFEKVKRFSGKDFLISDIDNRWIDGFIKHCQTEEKNNSGGIGNSKNTISYAFRLIKRIVNYSDTENHYLRKLVLSYDRNIRSKLTIDEIESMRKLVLKPGTLIYHTRNIFLVQYYFRGMRIADALRLEKSDINGGRLTYDARKTGVQYDMKIVAPCMEILREYMDNDSYYLFPILRRIEPKTDRVDFMNEVKNRTMKVNFHLKEIAKACGINKKVTTHIARHSFASIADQQLGGDLKTLQGLFGHSSRKITEIYIRDLRKTDDLDDAADKILG